jgi:hypothetical protein
MTLDRTTIRYVAAGISAVMAAIYFLIGAGVVTVVTAQQDDPSMLAFGVMAGSGFLLGAVLLVAFDRRWLWILGAILQLFVAVAYFSLAPQRDPPFEPWGIILRVLQLPLLGALVYLAWRPSDGLRAVSGGAQR